jgi:membrane protein involved in colicin uptake
VTIDIPPIVKPASAMIPVKKKSVVRTPPLIQQVEKTGEGETILAKEANEAKEERRATKQAHKDVVKKAEKDAAKKASKDASKKAIRDATNNIVNDVIKSVGI